MTSTVPAKSRWNPPTGTLGRIVDESVARAARLETSRAALEQAAAAAPALDEFSRALEAKTVCVIAEVKRKSPSKGDIAPTLDGTAQAEAYLAGGAAAASILTEPAHFGGSADDFQRIRADVKIPALKKDFHVAPIQLLEAKALRASAALLIVRALSPMALDEMMSAARELALEVVVEVRDEQELARALDAGATLIGVNNRNLETLVIDPARAEAIIPLIPSHLIAIAESGMRTRDDVERYARIGADAVLIGSSLSASPDPVAATRELTGLARVRRAG